MQSFTCPSCGGEITFQSSVSVSCVCPYCRSLIVRHDKDIEAMGKVAELPADISPFQIGTTGSFTDDNHKNIGFTLVGRMKIGWTDGNWNEWFIVTDDGRKGWLAEAQGSLAISFEFTDELHANTTRALDSSLDKFATQKTYPSLHPVPQTKRPELGSVLSIDGRKFTVADIKEATCIASEGELPFTAPQGRKTTSIDLNSDAGEFASIEVENDTRRFYVGRYIAFNDLKFSNLRELPGWSNKRPPVTAAPRKNADAGW